MRAPGHAKAAGRTMVPMADMLSSTVGVVIFMLIFTVLAAGGASAIKQLPIERSTDADAVNFVCMDGRVYAIDPSAIRSFTDRAGPLEPALQSIETFNAWAKRFGDHKVTTDDATVTGSAGLVPIARQGMLGYSSRASLRFALRPDGGERVADLGTARSRYEQKLDALERNKHFVHFIVTPDGVDAFNAARELATQRGLETGWAPHTDREGVSIGILGGGGWEPRPGT